MPRWMAAQRPASTSTDELMDETVLLNWSLLPSPFGLEKRVLAVLERVSLGIVDFGGSGEHGYGDWYDHLPISRIQIWWA